MIARHDFIKKSVIGLISILFTNKIFGNRIYNINNSTLAFQTIPKIENHLHLEGAIPLETIWQLIQKYGGDKSVFDINQLKEKFVYQDFIQFIKTWSWKNQFIREYDDFALLSNSVFQDLIKQNVKYAEIFISPSLFKNRLEIQRIVETISTEIRKNNKIHINLIVDLVRDYGAASEMRTLYEINEVKNYGIIGIGIGGSENEYPPELFKGVYEQARQFGFKTTAHAGEASGPKSIWGAINELKVDRIGHGTRAIEDKELLKYLADYKIPIEVCPISNLRTKVIKTMKDHPIKTFIDLGIPVSINTDDPKMFNNSLSEEYQLLKETFNYSRGDINNIIINSIHTTCLDKKDKENLIIEFKKELM
jgi:adenosine deaminase